jgi:hypothetical protein
VSGNLDFTNGTLIVTGGGPEVIVSQPVTLVTVSGTTTAGTHPPEGAAILLGSNHFSLSYVGGTGRNNVVLNVVVVLPSVTSPTSTNVGPLTATLGGDVTDNGGGVLSKRGIVFSTNPSVPPVIGGPGVIEVDDPSATLGIFADIVNGLAPGTTYYFAAFAQNSAGDGYSSTAHFTTTTGPASGINGPNTLVVNHSGTFTLLASDPSPGMQTYFFVFHIKWCDGTNSTVTQKSGTTFNHTYTAVGTYTISISAVDGRGATLPTGTFTVVVTATLSPGVVVGGGTGGLLSGNVSGGLQGGGPTGGSLSSNATTSRTTSTPASTSSGVGGTGSSSSSNQLAAFFALGNKDSNDSIVDSLFSTGAGLNSVLDDGQDGPSSDIKGRIIMS